LPPGVVQTYTSGMLADRLPTDRQHEILKFIEDFTERFRPVTYRDFGPGWMRLHELDEQSLRAELAELHRKGFIVRGRWPHYHNTIELRIPLVGEVC
jgi:hypothetical protein